MKRLFIFLLSAGTIVTARAQQNVSFGPTVGFGHSWLSGVNGDQKFHPSFNVGASLVYSPSTHWGFGADLKYAREGAKRAASANDNAPTTSINLDYLRLPLKAYYFFGNYGDAVRPKVALGPTLGFMLGAKSTYDDNNHETTTDVKDGYKTFDIGLQGSAGVNIRVARNTWLNTDLTYYHGLADIRKAANNSIYNRNIGVNVGLTFGIGTYVEK